MNSWAEKLIPPFCQYISNVYLYIYTRIFLSFFFHNLFLLKYLSKISFQRISFPTLRTDPRSKVAGKLAGSIRPVASKQRLNRKLLRSKIAACRLIKEGGGQYRACACDKASPSPPRLSSRRALTRVEINPPSRGACCGRGGSFN